MQMQQQQAAEASSGGGEAAEEAEGDGNGGALGKRKERSSFSINIVSSDRITASRQAASSSLPAGVGQLSSTMITMRGGLVDVQSGQQPQVDTRPGGGGGGGGADASGQAWQ